VTHTVTGVTANVPVVGNVVDHVVSSVDAGASGIHADAVAGTVSHVTSTVVNTVDSHASDLNIGQATGGLADLHGLGSLPSTDDIHLLGH